MAWINMFAVSPELEQAMEEAAQQEEKTVGELVGALVEFGMMFSHADLLSKFGVEYSEERLHEITMRMEMDGDSGFGLQEERGEPFFTD